MYIMYIYIILKINKIEQKKKKFNVKIIYYAL